MAKIKKKKQGFGESQVPTRAAKRFMIAFGQKKGDEFTPFLTANLEKLDESLLEALPLVFADITKGKDIDERQTIAGMFVNFGVLLWQFPRGLRWLNLELSIKAYELALGVFTPKAFPKEWATTQMNLGVAYEDRIRGDRAENLETAIATYDRALEVFTRKDLPQDWADTQMNLGTAYSDRIRGERAENLETAIAAYDRALEVFTREDLPQDWAKLQMNLGSAYGNRIRGERAENLETAIAAYDRALEVFTPEDFPQDWANAQMNLGNAYRNRIRGERAENLETATTNHENALQVFTRKDFPKDWAGTQSNLGLVYIDRLQGDKSENIEKAIHAFSLCLGVYTQESFPEDWAKIQHNLADAYLKRVKADTTDNIEQAISLYNQAAEVFTKSAYPYKWFRNQAHLASAYLARAELYDSESEKIENLNTAISLLKEVLETADPSAPTPDYIDAQFHLGTAFRQRHNITKGAADLRAAGTAYETALNAISPEHYDREKMWQAIPETQTILGSRLVRDGEWHKGLELLQAAVKELAPQSQRNPRAYANALYQIGRTYEIMSNWKDARIYYRDALRLYEHIDDALGMANCHQGLGAVLGCQGSFSKCMNELSTARDFYTKLGLTEKLEEVDGLRRAAETGQQELDSLTWSIAR